MNKRTIKIIEKRYLLTFIVITFLFALWGFANDFTNPMVATFQTLMELSSAKASLIQFAFYGGYATMALPAALFIRKYSNKSGILLGLVLYAIGVFLAIPATSQNSFLFFCMSLYIMTFGLAFLETTAAPLILSLGQKETATRRLNLAQLFNPIGSLSGMLVASLFVLPNLISDRRSEDGKILFSLLSEFEKIDIRIHDMSVIRTPYIVLGIVLLIVLGLICFLKIPKMSSSIKQHNTIKKSLLNLWNNRVYREGVVALLFYVASQIMVWTFIIQYADNLGINKSEAQNYNIIAMLMSVFGRFISTIMMKYINGCKILFVFAIGGILTALGAVFIVGIYGLYCLVGISLFMSLMFPTIYGIALENVESEDVSLGSAFLIMAIVGGAVLPPLQGLIIDCGQILGYPAVNISYLLPVLCFIIITIYALRTNQLNRNVL